MRLAVGAATLLLAGLTTGVVGPSHAARADPAYQQPAVGTCHSYPYAAVKVFSESSPAVSCAGPHTARTVAVQQRAPGLTAQQALDRYLPRCYAALQAALGGARTVAVTAYDLVLFTPSRVQQDQGARWLRCDLVLMGGRQLEPLPTPLVTSPLSDAVVRCTTGRRLVATVCTRPHTYRAVATITGSGPFPSRSRFARLSRACAAKVGGRPFVLSYPTAPQWRSGTRAMACLAKTRT